MPGTYTAQSPSMILPGQTIGILGSGQLGRMLANAAHNLGYHVAIYSPDHNSPAGQVSDWEVTADYLDLVRLKDFARQVDVLTLEFENIPRASLDLIAEHVPTRPSSQILHISQHRCREKTELSNLGLPVTPFRRVDSVTALETAYQELGPEIIVKTVEWGYDGKGQSRIKSLGQCKTVWEEMGQQEMVAEKCIPFEAECSVVGVRNVFGEFRVFGPMRNVHANHILDVSIYPGGFSAELEKEAREIVHTVMDAFNVIGLLCIEFFVQNGKLMINEMAPRPHNSGHLTMNGHVSSQFEQHIRAICGLPLGSNEALRPSAMVNLLGDEWFPEAPKWDRALALPDVHLHLYGKAEARHGRKMGHINAVGATPAEAEALAIQARAALRT